MQEKALRKLVKHAYTSVPYYHELFDSLGLKPEDVNSVSDLHLVPILTKDTILANYPNRILSSDVNWSKCSPRMTSGSSGKKLEVVLDYEVAALYRLMQFRQLLDVGYKPWDKIAYIRFSPPVTNIILQKLNFFRRHYIPLECKPEQQLQRSSALNPKSLMPILQCFICWQKLLIEIKAKSSTLSS